MHKINPFYILLLHLIVTGCSDRKLLSNADDISVGWELISNTYTDREQGKAVFTIGNTSHSVMHSSGWALYFNMLPRKILPAGDSTRADVMHINGDWYRMVPRKNFNLKPREKTNIYYEFEGYQIKETDAPTGLYAVFYNRKGKEKAIVPVTQYTIRPFVREEQMKRSMSDSEPLSTPEYLYRKYQNDQIKTQIDPLPFIPSPVSMKITGTSFILDSRYKIYFDPELEQEAKYLQQKLAEIAGLKLQLAGNTAPVNPVVQLIYQQVNINNNDQEAYRITTSEGLITITGTPAGIFYGIQSLMNLIPFEVYKDKPGKIELPALIVSDAPRFSYRGLHIDVCRNFQSKEQILKLLDLMAKYKLNTLHLYLTEDEAWRLEIYGLPELTEIGSRRGHSLDESEFLQPSYGSGPFPDSENNHGTGFYSRSDFIEIIRYAHNCYIQVIPSINFPGHARAAIKAMEVRYSRLTAEEKLKEANEFRLIDPDDRSIYQSAQFYNDNVVCVARESVYHFFEIVVDAVIKMYHEAGVPLEMIYTGGDEVPEGAWSQSPLCDELMKKLPGMDDPKNLQTYFFKRITGILKERNLKTGGWEEVALIRNEAGNNMVNPEFRGGEVIPYIWNNLSGSQDLAYRVANTGYPVVLCPVSNFYFDLAYSNHPEEPGLYWGGFNDVRDAWEFAPFNLFITTTKTSMGESIDIETEYADMERLHPDAYDNILGMQAQLWHETIKGGEMMEYYLLPRLIAFAERCWSKETVWETLPDKEARKELADKSWQQFEYTLYNAELPKLTYWNDGYNYRIPPLGARIKNDSVKANTLCSGLVIHYTTDGTDPILNFSAYSLPVEAIYPIKLRVFDMAGHASRVTVIEE